MINKYPTKCNICGGKVVYISNKKIYGKEYGSGMCYYCTNCGAYVGTHIGRKTEALGLLSNKRMRNGKMACHQIFDSFWKGKKKQSKKRKDLYVWLASQMDIPVEECHFGYFNLNELIKAYKILFSVKKMEMKYDNCGNVFFE